jgi:integrase/recombinase XerD
MVYYKLILDDKRSKEDQIYPVVIRVTSNRVATTITTGIRVHVQYWDKQSQYLNKGCSNAALFISQLYIYI